MFIPVIPRVLQRAASACRAARAAVGARAPRVLCWADVLLEAQLGLALPPVERALAAWPGEGASAACPRCGQSVGEGEVLPAGCAACSGHRSHLDRVVRLGPYAEPLRTWILQIKQGVRWEEMAEALGRRLGGLVLERPLAAAPRPARFVVIPVAMPLPRRLARRIDHAACLSRGVGAVLEAPVIPLLRREAGPVQTGLARSRRRQEGRRRWHLASWARQLDLRGVSVVLVDDVRTTGTTLEAAARQLRRAQPLSVTAAVIAVAGEPGRAGTATGVS